MCNGLCFSGTNVKFDISVLNAFTIVNDMHLGFESSFRSALQDVFVMHL